MMMNLGFGLGLRPQHFEEALAAPQTTVDWFEILTENYLTMNSYTRTRVLQLRARYPLVMHGVSLSIGSTDPLDFTYLSAVKNLNLLFQPAWISDHLCWTGSNAHNTHDLLPLPMTQETIDHVVARIQTVQEYLGREIILENVSTYLDYAASAMPEWEFITAVAKASGSKILLDINNVYVNAYNHGFDPFVYLAQIPETLVQQIHLAGHTNCGDYILDTHDAEVILPVWDLYAASVRRFGAIATLLERDEKIPAWPVLVAELDAARKIQQSVLVNRGEAAYSA